MNFQFGVKAVTLYVEFFIVIKGQEISKGNFGICNSSKNEQNSVLTQKVDE